ncbi:hypothetical protein [Nonomuraea sp. NPDC050310]|uniref:hypothetical protein n=1 Tax=unclassified Nonomuraea TaxID=2593643 RepID=UPI0033D2C28C
MTQPYDSQPGYGAYQPYGAPYGQHPPPAYAYGAPPPQVHREIERARTNAIVALVVNLIGVVSCFNVFGIAGAIVAGKALGRVTTEPARARVLTRWAWSVFAAGFVLMAAFIAVMIVLDSRGI